MVDSVAEHIGQLFAVTGAITSPQYLVEMSVVFVLELV